MGAGSLGPVFRGEDPDSHDAVAIKLIQIGLTPPQVHTVADALAVLVADWPAHPFLAAPVGAGTVDAAPYVVWPLVVGDPLDVALREYGPAAAPDAAERLVGLAEALDAAAEVGAWHGALHPRDIIVGERETVVVGAGIVPILERVGARPSIRRPYVSPEVLGGERSSPASDQYPLAAIAYEWLFGVRITGPADALMTVPAIPDVDCAALAEAFTSALAAAPGERFADCRAFVEALVTATGGPHPRRAARTPRPRRPRADAEPLPLMFAEPHEVEAVEATADFRRDEGAADDDRRHPADMRREVIDVHHAGVDHDDVDHVGLHHADLRHDAEFGHDPDSSSRSTVPRPGGSA